MAAVRLHGALVRVAAQSEDEHALLAFALEGGRELVLEGAVYPVDDSGLVLPDSVSEGAADRVRRAFESAATRHRQAEVLRGRFRSI